MSRCVRLRFLQQNQSKPIAAIATAKPAKIDPTKMDVVDMVDDVDDVDVAADAVLLAETDAGREVLLVRDAIVEGEVKDTDEDDGLDDDDVKVGSGYV